MDLIGRIFISSVFLLSGYNKIFNYENTVAWMEGFGVPGFLLGPAIAFEIPKQIGRIYNDPFP